MKQNTAESETINSFEFLDFQNFDELQANTCVFIELVDVYQKIFAEPGIWEEHYSHEQIINNIKQEIAGCACLRVCLNQENHHVIGFCWVQAISLIEVIAALDTVEYYHRSGKPDLWKALNLKLGDEKVIYVHDLGIIPKYRKQVPLFQLIYPVIKNVALRSEISKILFWSSPETCIHHLAQKAEVPMILANSNMQFFLGDINKGEFLLQE